MRRHPPLQWWRHLWTTSKWKTNRWWIFWGSSSVLSLASHAVTSTSCEHGSSRVSFEHGSVRVSCEHGSVRKTWKHGFIIISCEQTFKTHLFWPISIICDTFKAQSQTFTQIGRLFVQTGFNCKWRGSEVADCCSRHPPTPLSASISEKVIFIPVLFSRTKTNIHMSNFFTSSAVVMLFRSQQTNRCYHLK